MIFKISSLDTAKFTPEFVSVFFVKIPLIIPISSPFLFTNAPPEEPGLAAASVWTKFSILLKPVFFLPIADTTPQVIPKSKPKELLIKQAELAIFGLSFEIFIGVISISALIMAISVFGSSRINFALNFLDHYMGQHIKKR